MALLLIKKQNTMGMFGKMGEMMKLQSQAKKIKKELANTHVFAEAGGVKVTVNGEQQLVDISYDETAPQSRDQFIKKVIEAGNKASKKAQTVAAEKMQAVMGGLQGLMGGK